MKRLTTKGKKVFIHSLRRMMKESSSFVIKPTVKTGEYCDVALFNIDRKVE